MGQEDPPAIVTIQVRDRGSLRVWGRVRLIDGEGAEIEQPDDGRGFIGLCRCGQSKMKPYCDSSHRECGWDSVVRAPEVGEQLEARRRAREEETL
jgi:CDGSH-type Zn-finger protein